MIILRKKCSIAAIAGLLLFPALNAQTVHTSPSGYVKLKAVAATSATAPSYSFVNHALAQDRKSAGVITGGGTDIITASASSWEIDEFAGINGPHFLIFTDGSLEGRIYDIESNTANTLTLSTGSGNTSALTGDSFRIYKHNTLASVFGADPTVNGFQGGLDADNSDQVILYNGTSFNAYFYKNQDIPDFLDPNDIIGWVSATNDEVDLSDLVLPPNKGVIVLRRSTASDFEIPVFGDVIDDSINVPIVDGYNLVSVPYPISGTVTLASSGLYSPSDTTYQTSLQPGLDANSAELVVTWNGSGYVQYFYKDQDIPDFLDSEDIVGWVTSADDSVDVGSTTLSGGFFILRKAPNPPLDWVFPSVLAP